MMSAEKPFEILRCTMATLVVTSMLAACGGGGGGGAPSSSSSGSGTPPTVTPPPSGSTILFQQPQESGIADQVMVPHAVGGAGPPGGVFRMVFWQTNPNTVDGNLVPSSWNAGTLTGFTPSAPLSSYQLGFFADTPSSTTAQMENGTVGAYLNSADLPNSPKDQKMMITPQYDFTSSEQTTPFANSGTVLNASMYLQVPTAAGSNTYVVADHLCVGPNGVRVSYGVKLFANGVDAPTVGSNYNSDSNDYLLNTPLTAGQQFLSIAPESQSDTGTPWTGWRYFAWSISATQFGAGLAYLAAQYPDAVTSTDPSLYTLIEVHLNAEFQFQPEPAQLGWSMYGWQVWLTTGS